MLSTQLNEKVANNTIVKDCIVKLTSFVINTLQNRK
jgi:hypothetical protein